MFGCLISSLSLTIDEHIVNTTDPSFCPRLDSFLILLCPALSGPGGSRTPGEADLESPPVADDPNWPVGREPVAQCTGEGGGAVALRAVQYWPRCPRACNERLMSDLNSGAWRWSMTSGHDARDRPPVSALNSRSREGTGALLPRSEQPSE